MKYWLCIDEKIIQLVDEFYVCQAGEEKHKEDLFGWWQRLEDGTNVKGSLIDPGYTGKKYKYRKDELKNVGGEAQLKTEDEIKFERLLELQRNILFKMKDINIAIASQDATNKIKKKKSKAEIYTISEDDIEAIGDFQNAVTTFHQSWTIGDYTSDDNGNLFLTSDPGIANELIFNGGLAIPEIIARLIY